MLGTFYLILYNTYYTILDYIIPCNAILQFLINELYTLHFKVNLYNDFQIGHVYVMDVN